VRHKKKGGNQQLRAGDHNGGFNGLSSGGEEASNKSQARAARGSNRHRVSWVLMKETAGNEHVSDRGSTTLK